MVILLSEMLGEKSSWELHKDAACCFEHMQEISAL